MGFLFIFAVDRVRIIYASYWFRFGILFKLVIGIIESLNWVNTNKFIYIDTYTRYTHWFITFNITFTKQGNLELFILKLFIFNFSSFWSKKADSNKNFSIFNRKNVYFSWLL